MVRWRCAAATSSKPLGAQEQAEHPELPEARKYGRSDVFLGGSSPVVRFDDVMQLAPTGPMRRLAWAVAAGACPRARRASAPRQGLSNALSLATLWSCALRGAVPFYQPAMQHGCLSNLCFV